jgi:hypothetical protein
LVGAAACGNKAEVARAKRSIYDTDFAIVYGKTLEATREIYDRTEDNPKSGAIKTAWHQVTYATNPEDVQGGRSLAAGATPVTNSPAAAQAGMPTRLAYKRYFVRFDVVVSGGRPWRVKVVGHASEWEPGAALPVELTGPARPPWLDGRTDALILAIHKKLRGFAVAMPEETPAPKPEDLIPRTDPTKFANVPSEAAKRMAQIKDAVVRREYPLLREQVFDDVVWNLGASPGIEIALATWQADPEALDAMARVIGEACAGSGKKVACPTAARPGQWQLVLEQRGEVWKVASFVRAE